MGMASGLYPMGLSPSTFEPVDEKQRVLYNKHNFKILGGVDYVSGFEELFTAIGSLW
jgi:hypothetical protein